MWSTIKVFSITVILEDTLDPQDSIGFTIFYLILLFKLSISFNNNPKHFIGWENCAMIVVEACALWLFQSTSFT
jgi:hypothetical protein